MVVWPNGKALDYESRDSRFEYDALTISLPCLSTTNDLRSPWHDHTPKLSFVFCLRLCVLKECTVLIAVTINFILLSWLARACAGYSVQF